MATYRSSTQQRRAQYDYRREYFKKNPGLFGYIWFCSQCGKPLLGKSNVVIDHIIPLGKGGRNHVSNCTACCYKCNQAKSDTVDGRVVRGYVFKFFESNLFRAQRGGMAVLGLIIGLSASLVCQAFRLGKGTVKAVLKPVVRRTGHALHHRHRRRSRKTLNLNISGLPTPLLLFICVAVFIGVLYLFYNV